MDIREHLSGRPDPVANQQHRPGPSPEPPKRMLIWDAEVHSGLRVYFNADGQARYSTVGSVDVQDDVLDAIANLRAQADALEAWMRAWSKQGDHE